MRFHHCLAKEFTEEFISQGHEKQISATLIRDITCPRVRLKILGATRGNDSLSIQDTCRATLQKSLHMQGVERDAFSIRYTSLSLFSHHLRDNSGRIRSESEAQHYREIGSGDI